MKDSNRFSVSDVSYLGNQISEIALMHEIKINTFFEGMVAKGIFGDVPPRLPWVGEVVAE